MQTFIHSALPSLFGAAGILTFLHISRAILGAPGFLFKKVESHERRKKVFKEYYRTWESWVPTCLMILSVAIAGGAASYFDPGLAVFGYFMSSPMIAVVVGGIGIILALMLEEILSCIFLGRAITKTD